MTVSTPADPATDRGTATVGIAADDLTGANDSAVQFARTGWSTRLSLGDLTGSEDAGPGIVGSRDPAPRGPGRAVAVVTDARPMSDEDAKEATAAAVASLVAAGADRLYLKIDSTMRGSIPAQVDGALQAWSRNHPDAWAVVCPAYPPMGRTVEDGVLHVGGVPVAETVIGQDPVTPVSTSAMRELVPGSAHVAGDLARTGPEAVAARLREAAQDATGGSTGGSSGAGRVVTVDARAAEDVTVLAQAIAALGPHVVPVGSAGLAIAMAETWRADDRVAPSQETPAAGAGSVLAVVSSLHSVSREQVDALVAGTPAQDIAVLAPGLGDLTDASTSAWLDRTMPADQALPRVVLLLSPVERGAQGAAVQVAASLAQVAQSLLDRDQVGALVLVGGDGAGAVLDRIGAASIKVAGTVQEGIPVGRIEGGTAEGLTVVTKAGGFGPPSALLDVIAALTTS